MATQFSPQSTEQNDRSRVLLPCISVDELLKQPPPSSRGSMPKTPSKQRLRVNSEPNVSNPSDQVKNSSVKIKDAVDDAVGKGKMSSYHRKVSRHASLPVEDSKEKDCNQGNTKATKGSKTVKRQVKLSAPSPDVIDLSKEDVVHELMLRLFETLRVPDSTCHGSLREQNKCIVEESCKISRPNRSKKVDNGINLFRHHTTRFPRVSKSTSNLEVFYSKPTSWKNLMSNRQLQPRARAKPFLAFQEPSTKMDQPVKETTIHMNYRHFTWSCKKNCAPAGRSTSVLRKRGLNVPFIVTNGSAFVSSEMIKTSFESRKSVTFAE